MGIWKVTADDRGPDGKIVVNPFDAEIARALHDVGAEPASPPSPEGGTHAPLALPARQYLAASVVLLLLAVALIALARQPTGAPAAPRAPLAPPTALPTITIAPSATTVPTPTATPQPTATPEPTKAPVFAPPTPTVCTIDNAPYQERRQVAPIGSVVGISCQSADEARANADSLAAAMIATATAEARP
jgi:hypothetical protein